MQLGKVRVAQQLVNRGSAGLAAKSQAWSRCEQLDRREGTPAPRPLELILVAERARGGRGSRGLRTDLSRSGDADRAGVRHEVGGPCHEYAGCAEEQQQS